MLDWGQQEFPLPGERVRGHFENAIQRERSQELEHFREEMSDAGTFCGPTFERKTGIRLGR